MRQQLADMMRWHAIENEAFLDALEWKFRKLWTERDMLMRERDRLRADCDSLRKTKDIFFCNAEAWEARAVAAEAELKSIKGDAWTEAGQ